MPNINFVKSQFLFTDQKYSMQIWLINPLSLIRDQQQNSPLTINVWSTREVRRIDDKINLGFHDIQLILPLPRFPYSSISLREMYDKENWYFDSGD